MQQGHANADRKAYLLSLYVMEVSVGLSISQWMLNRQIHQAGWRAGLPNEAV
jgi:hypothetical protein